MNFFYGIKTLIIRVLNRELGFGWQKKIKKPKKLQNYSFTCMNLQNEVLTRVFL